jgi:hypothetical protein
MPVTDATWPPADRARPHRLEALLADANPSGDVLPAGTAIGSFVLTRVRERDAFAVRYAARASASDVEVTIEEYLPERIATRGDDGVLGPRDRSQAGLFDAGLHAFLEESEQLSRLAHPALLRIGPIWRARGSAYRLRLDLSGELLSALRPTLREEPDEAWLRRLFEPLAGALERVHAAGLVHGNVRPGNIVLGPDGQVLLLDFGAAGTAIAAVAPWHAAWPEPEYRAPETFEPRRRASPGPAGDVYALAAVLRYGLTGQAPAASAAPLAATHGGSRVGAGMAAAIDQALSPDPQERPASVAAFRAALERLNSPLPAAPSWRALAPRPAPAEEAAPVLPPQPERMTPRDAVRGAEQAAQPPGPVQAAEPFVDRAPDLPAPARERPPTPPVVDEAGGRAAPWLPVEAPEPGPRHEPIGALRPGAERAEAVRVAAATRRRWPWALGGMAIGAALMAAAAGELDGLADPARQLWSALAQRVGLPAWPGAPSAAPSVPVALLPAPDETPPAPPPPSAAVPAAPAPLQALPEASVNAPAAQAVAAPAAPADLVEPAAAPPAAPAASAAAPAPPRARPPTTRAKPPAATSRTRAAAQKRTAAALPATPAAACAPRSNFSLYWCMTKQCEAPRFYAHPQCVRLRRSGETS